MSGCICNDCGIDTTPNIGKWEFYSVTDDVWEAARLAASTVIISRERAELIAEARRANRQGVLDSGFMNDHFLCIGCLEQRIGRRLTALDFTVCPVNNPGHQNNTQRLRDRLNDQLPQSRKDYYVDVRKHYGEP